MVHSLIVGPKGRIVLPAALRDRRRWPVGTELVAIERESGVELVSIEELRGIVRAELADDDLVSDLIADRRAAAAAEDG